MPPRSKSPIVSRVKSPPAVSSCREEVGVVKRVHLLSGEVRRVAVALEVVEEVQEEVQEVKDECEDEEVERKWRTRGRRDTRIM